MNHDRGSGDDELRKVRDPIAMKMMRKWRVLTLRGGQKNEMLDRVSAVEFPVEESLASPTVAELPPR